MDRADREFVRWMEELMAEEPEPEPVIGLASAMGYHREYPVEWSDDTCEEVAPWHRA